MPTPCWLKHLCSIRALFPMSVCLSLSLYSWLIPWSVKAGCVTQGILASFLLSVSHHRLRTTRFWSNKGPTSCDPGWLTSVRRVTARDQRPRRDTCTWHDAPAVHPGKWVAGMGQVIRCTTQLGKVRSPTTWSPEQLIPGRAQNAYPTESMPLWGTREPEWCRSRKCMQPRALIRQVPSRATRSLSSVTGKAHTPWAEANSVWPGQFMRSPHTPVIFLWVFLPPHITNEPNCEPK